MQWLELKVPPLVVGAGFAVVMFLLSRAFPQLTAALPGRVVVALALAVVGAAVAMAGVLAFRAHKTTVNPLAPGASSMVVSSGIYRLSRNPMYLGFLLALAGWATYLSNAAAAMLLPAFIAYMTQFQIKPEERALLAKFGAQFTQYMSSVRRWL